MLKNKLKLTTSLILVLAISTAVTAQTGYIVDENSNSVSEMIYTWMSADTTPYYQDAMGENPDVAPAICGEEQRRHLGLVHAMNEDIDPEWILISYESGNNHLPLADTEITVGGESCYRTGIGGYVVSPSHFSGNDPEVHIAAHPSDASLLFAEDSTGSGAELVNIETDLSGGYSGSMSYHYSTNEIEFSLDTIRPDTDVGTQTYSPTDSGRGIATNRPLLAGICRDDSGRNCPAEMSKVDDPGYFGRFNIESDIPHEDVNDQNTYTRYGVINSLEAESLDIGTDLEVHDLEVTHDPVYYSQEQNITFTVTNRGNVPMESGTSIDITVENVDRNQVVEQYNEYINRLEIGESTSFEIPFDTHQMSGIHEVEVDANPEGQDIEELNHYPSYDTTDFLLRVITQPDIYIDGEETKTFEETGRPFNLSMRMQDSDNVSMPNATVRITEEAGVNNFIPTQSWEADAGQEIETRGTTSVTHAEFKSDRDGWVSITVIPTGNRLFAEEYEHLDAEEFLGDYKIKMSGHTYYNNSFIFRENDEFLNHTDFEVENVGEYGSRPPEGTELPNIGRHLDIAFKNIYTLFTRFRDWIS